MICTTNDMHGVTWLSIQDDNARVAVVPVTDVMVGDSARLHAMTGTGWVLVSKVIVTRIAGPQIMWEAQPSHYSEISTAMVPDLTHPLFIVSTLQRVIEGEYIPEAIECPPVIISLMTVRLPQDWMGSKEGRVWYTPCDRVYFHVVANDFFNGPMIAQHMGMDVVLSFIEVKLFRQSSTAKFYPSELCCSISTTICSSIVATEFLPPSLLSVLCLGEAATNNFVHSSTAHLNFVSQSPSPKTGKPSRSPSQSAGKKKEKHRVVVPASYPQFSLPTSILLKISNVCGIINEGDTCYVNSTLQAMYACTEFRTQAIQAAVDMVRKGKEPFTLTEHVNNLFLHMFLTPKTDVSASSMVAQFDLHGQQDAQEFLNTVLNRLDPVVVGSIFRFKMQSSVRCFGCDDRTSCEEPFMMLDVPFRDGITSLQELVELSLRPERLCGDNRFQCTTCKNLTDARRHMSMVCATNNLFIALKRFHYDELTKRRTKIMTSLNAPNLLAIPGVTATYHLRAFVAHWGEDPMSGHYVACHEVAGSWMVFNDDRYDDMQTINSKHDVTPYIYLYSRVEELVDTESPCIPDMKQWVSRMDLSDQADASRRADTSRRVIKRSASPSENIKVIP